MGVGVEEVLRKEEEEEEGSTCYLGIFRVWRWELRTKKGPHSGPGPSQRPEGFVCCLWCPVII